MAVTIIDVTRRYLSAAYDGTNGADLVAAISPATLVSDTGTVLTFNANQGDQFTANVGDVVIWQQDGSNATGVGVLTAGQYADAFVAV